MNRAHLLLSATLLAFVCLLSQQAKADCLPQSTAEAYWLYFLYDHDVQRPDDFGMTIVAAQTPDAHADAMTKLCAGFTKELHSALELRYIPMELSAFTFRQTTLACSDLSSQVPSPQERAVCDFLTAYAELFSPKSERKAIQKLEKLAGSNNSEPLTTLLSLLAAKAKIKTGQKGPLLQAQKMAPEFRAIAYWLNAQTFKAKADANAANAAMEQAYRNQATRYLTREAYLPLSLRAALYTDSFENHVQGLIQSYGSATLDKALKNLFMTLPKTEYNKVSAFSFIGMLLKIQNLGATHFEAWNTALQQTLRLEGEQLASACDLVIKQWPSKHVLGKNMLAPLKRCLAQWLENPQATQHRLHYQNILDYAPSAMSPDDHGLYIHSLLAQQQHILAREAMQNLNPERLTKNKALDNTLCAINHSAPKLFSSFGLEQARCIAGMPEIDLERCTLCPWLELSAQNPCATPRTLSAKLALDLSSCKHQDLGHDLRVLNKVANAVERKSITRQLLSSIHLSSFIPALLTLARELGQWDKESQNQFNDEQNPEFLQFFAQYTFPALEFLPPKSVLEALSSLVETWPQSEHSPKFRLAMGIACRKQNMLPLAMQHWESVYTLYPQSEYASRAMYWAIQTAKSSKNTDEVQRLENLQSELFPPQ